MLNNYAFSATQIQAVPSVSVISCVNFAGMNGPRESKVLLCSEFKDLGWLCPTVNTLENSLFETVLSRIHKRIRIKKKTYNIWKLKGYAKQTIKTYQSPFFRERISVRFSYSIKQSSVMGMKSISSVAEFWIVDDSHFSWLCQRRQTQGRRRDEIVKVGERQLFVDVLRIRGGWSVTDRYSGLADQL